MQDKASKAFREKISKNFYLDEFLCECGQCVYSKQEISKASLLDLVFIKKLQRLRDDFGTALQINSGARCRDYNQLIGGATRSGHIVDFDLPCRAADVSTIGFSHSQRHELLRLAMVNGFRGIGIAKTFLHFDTKPRRAYWTYS